MKKLVSLCFLFAVIQVPAQAQEGFSPTLPFGTKDYRTQRPVTVPCNPYQGQYYQQGAGYQYYYGPNGIYNQQNVSQGSATSNPSVRSYNRQPIVQPGDTLPSYQNPSSSWSRTLPGY